MENQSPTGLTEGNDFLTQLTVIIGDNLSDENFGVSELASEVNMSRSNLLRKISKLTRLSASQFIRQERLKKGMELLRQTSMNVSEVSYKVGFGSTSYFIKCFREYYGYPPGEVGKRDHHEPLSAAVPEKGKSLKIPLLAVAAFLVVGATVWWFFYPPKASEPAQPALDKSIAVLPFKNESNDSTNVYLINGLMESTLTNLQKMRDVRVISRTSSEKYRNTSKSIPEMAKELNVSYFVEGSGQKIGDKILLNIQLIEAATDRHLWAKQYRREAKDIFELQEEVAKNIAEEIQVFITPEEEERIGKRPTESLAAYDFYLKGTELFYQSTGESLKASIPYYKNAIDIDDQFALAYADLTMVYFYLDIYRSDKLYSEEISQSSERAFALDPTLAESLVAKALAYIYEEKNEQAVPYLEKALEYNPNSGVVLHFLSEYYFSRQPDTGKYLEYALMKARVDIAADSTTQSYNYLQISNALVQAGFVEEALFYIDNALAYEPDNTIAKMVKVFTRLAKTRSFAGAKDFLMKELESDPNNVMFLQELGNTCFVLRDYENSYRYYSKFIHLKDSLHLDLYTHANLKIGAVYEKMGFSDEARQFISRFKRYADDDPTIYMHVNQAAYFAYLKDWPKAIEEVTLFSKQDNFYIWVLMLDMDPMFEPIKDRPEFQKAFGAVKAKFWKDHEEIKASLEEKGLLPITL
ncbi:MULTISPECIES: helix-turn-helix domain-containing protein [unclassified Imperialibacter]|uniref:helix-turn-helix domain-containing protein n=1 Tax=unclassified Imperialibacter TaxID=2629706 RepID=UPI0012517A31|nr:MULTISPECIES: helix-turn-helix domain-containing protein [unclassified Imperialibacter]CAD5251259.1 Transcriptional regulator, AraC family [Imperialibacter sp. 89]CAD5284310.1 Transcriptional regulator, AraC family [Imperialibacter sp. 75]VVT11084.1 Transcriptional regulator, AraC family [Imperialibacter sp. EC-SDR9]